MNKELQNSLPLFRHVRKIVKSDLASSCPSALPRGTTRFPLDGFSCNLICKDFSEIDEKIQVAFKLDKNNGCCT